MLDILSQHALGVPNSLLIVFWAFYRVYLQSVSTTKACRLAFISLKSSIILVAACSCSSSRSTSAGLCVASLGVSSRVAGSNPASTTASLHGDTSHTGCIARRRQHASTETDLYGCVPSRIIIGPSQAADGSLCLANSDSGCNLLGPSLPATRTCRSACCLT
jgi:hypothetical protein